MEFEKQFSDKEAEKYFKLLFSGIWATKSLKEIIYGSEIDYLSHKKIISQKNPEPLSSETELSFLAGFLGDSIWDVFSNNHTVYKTDSGAAFEIGSWRGSGSFIADFIASENNTLTFDYMDFYMGHYDNAEHTLKSYEFIFGQLKKEGFDWKYAYPHIGLINFSDHNTNKLENYNPNKSLETEINKNNFLKLLNDINEERKEELQKGPLPSIILAYGKTFGNFPKGWIEI